MKKLVTVNIRKPIYGNHVYINSTVVNNAIRAGAMLEIVIPNGRTIVDPKEWKARGDIMKKVFRFPNNPMILYGGNVNFPSQSKGEIVKKEEKQQRLF